MKNPEAPTEGQQDDVNTCSMQECDARVVTERLRLLCESGELDNSHLNRNREDLIAALAEARVCIRDLQGEVAGWKIAARAIEHDTEVPNPACTAASLHAVVRFLRDSRERIFTRAIRTLGLIADPASWNGTVSKTFDGGVNLRDIALMALASLKALPRHPGDSVGGEASPGNRADFRTMSEDVLRAWVNERLLEQESRKLTGAGLR